MIEGYSIMDLVTLGSIAGMIVSVATVIYRNEKDTAMLKDKIKSLSKEHEQMKDSLEKSNHDSFESLKEKVFDQRLITTGETKRIKSDTTYIKDAMMTEKMARKNLYNHTSNAQEILDKLDFMREVINKNYELSAQNQDLINETKDLNDKIADLREQNQKKLENRKEINSKQLLGSIKRFEGQLAEFEMYGESEEIQFILKNIKNELSEFIS
ncbi:hypothetical protein LGW67_09695 [Streptococcus mutans]|nr:hypothetical protein [Streptococcus mutans]